MELGAAWVELRLGRSGRRQRGRDTAAPAPTPLAPADLAASHCPFYPPPAPAIAEYAGYAIPSSGSSPSTSAADELKRIEVRGLGGCGGGHAGGLVGARGAPMRRCCSSRCVFEATANRFVPSSRPPTLPRPSRIPRPTSLPATAACGGARATPATRSARRSSPAAPPPACTRCSTRLWPTGCTGTVGVLKGCQQGVAPGLAGMAAGVHGLRLANLSPRTPALSLDLTTHRHPPTPLNPAGCMCAARRWCPVAWSPSPTSCTSSWMREARSAAQHGLLQDISCGALGPARTALPAAYCPPPA